MSKNVKTFIVLLISFAMWFVVGIYTDGYGLGEEGLIVLFLVPIIISIIYYANAEKIKADKEQTKTLSEKYDVLEIYKGLAFSLMIVATGFFIYSLVQKYTCLFHRKYSKFVLSLCTCV